MELNEIFLAALDYECVLERSRFLDQACENQPQVREQIEKMLGNTQRLDGFLETPACAIQDVQDALLGSRTELQAELGSRLELQEHLGEGGMGSVWLARQTHPIDRLVAVKLMRPGLLSKNVLARFKAEQDTLGKLQHPNIAAVYDAGLTAESHPFFVMEYCDGLNIAEYCQLHSLSVRRRIELVLPICRALSYVHKKGILHRDIKPSNLLIVDYEGVATPKLIDFGIAKAIDENLQRATLESVPGALVGTPEYMAPELLCENNSQPTFQTDVYSVGATLYQLLTNTPPHGKMGSERTGLLEFLKRVHQSEPATPSAIAKNNGSDLGPELRGDLDWILLKSVDRDLNRRYKQITDLQDDLQNYLDGKPVTAHPPGLLYRVSKFRKRHQVPFYAIMGLMVALLLGTASLWWSWKNSIQSSIQISQADLRAKRLELAFLEDLRKDVKDSTERLTRADPEQKQAAREALSNLAIRWRKLSESLITDVERQPVTAEANLRLGKIYSALGQPDVAIGHLQEAEKAYRQISKSHPTDSAIITQRIDALSELARTKFDRGDVLPALDLFTQAVDLANDAHTRSPLDEELSEILIDLHHDLAKVHIRNGKPQEAIQSVDLAMRFLDELKEPKPNDQRLIEKSISLRNGRANVFRAAGNVDQAMAELNQARQDAQTLQAAQSQSIYLQELLGIQHQQLGMMLHLQGKHDEAIQELRLAKNLFTVLAQTYRSMPDYQERVASAANSLAVVSFLSGETDQGVAECLQAIDIWRSLADANESKPEYRKSQCEGEMNLGAMLSRAKRYDNSIQALNRGLQVAKTLAETYPQRIDFKLAYYRIHTVLAGVQWAAGNMPQAMQAITHSVELFREASGSLPDSIEIRDSYATALLTRGDYLLADEDWKQSLIDYQSALEIIRNLPRKVAGQAYPRDIASVLVLCGKAHQKLGDLKQSLECYQQAKELVQNKLKLAPQDAGALKFLESIDQAISSLQKDTSNPSAP